MLGQSGGVDGQGGPVQRQAYSTDDSSTFLVRRCLLLLVLRCWETITGWEGPNSLLNMPIGMSIGWGIAYRYLLTPSIGMRICRSIPIAWSNRSRETGTIGCCS